MTLAVGQQIGAHCNPCGGSRNSEVLHVEERAPFDDPKLGLETSAMLKCCDCNAVSLRRELWFADVTDDAGAPKVQISTLPPAVSRRLPNWWNEADMALTLPATLLALINECYVALHNDARQLAAMGLRAVIEGVARTNGSLEDTFDKHIDHLFKSGFVAKVDIPRLRAVLELGHAGVHRLHTPGETQLSACFDVVESMIATIYAHRSKVEQIRDGLPPRRREKKMPQPL